jgi:hypothetical protein
MVLNEVKDHYPRAHMYVYSSCLKLILHFVQDDIYGVAAIPQLCINPAGILPWSDTLLEEMWYSTNDAMAATPAINRDILRTNPCLTLP